MDPCQPSTSRTLMQGEIAMNCDPPQPSTSRYCMQEEIPMNADDSQASMSSAYVDDEMSGSASPAPSTGTQPPGENNNVVNAPKYGTLVPNRIFVGGLDPTTNDFDLTALFSQYGEIRVAKVIVDRAGVSKGYGFITFINEEDAYTLMKTPDKIRFRDRKLCIAPAIKKQPFASRFVDHPRAASYFTGSPMFYTPPVQYDTRPMQYHASNMQYNSAMQQPYNPLPPGHFDHVTGQFIPYPPPMFMQPPMDYSGLNMQPSQQMGYQMMYPQTGAQLQNTLYMAPQQQASYTSYAQPSSAWIDPGLSTQYPVPSSLPYLVPMY